MELRQALERAIEAADAKGIERLSERVATAWFSRVERLRADWLRDDPKSASQYAETFDRLATQAGTTDPVALLAFAAKKTSSPDSLRLYRAAIQRMSSRPLVKKLQEALREADRVNRGARKLAEGHALRNHVAIAYSGVVYENRLAPVADALDALAASFAEAKASAKPSGKKRERSHGQIRKLSKLPDDWQACMLTRMSRGLSKGKPGKWRAEAAASILTGVRPCELAGIQFKRQGNMLGVIVDGAKVGTALVPTKDPSTGKKRWKTATTGRAKRAFVFDLAKLDSVSLQAAEMLRDRCPVNGRKIGFDDVEGFGSAWRAAAGREFGSKLAPSAYANRHQFGSELKARLTGIAPHDQGKLAKGRREIADALGHASTATQSCYGRARHSRLKGLSGLVRIEATGTARDARGQAAPKRKTEATATQRAASRMRMRP